MTHADVKIGDKWMEEDFGFIFSEKHITPPEPKLSLIGIPGTSDVIDLTETLTGDVEYQEREITITLEHDGGRNTYYSKFSELANYIHGQKMTIVFSKDSGFFWVGRVAVAISEPRFYGSTITVTARTDPYKYERHNSLDPWPWDDLNFFDGIIREYASLPVPSSLTITGRRKKVMPIFHCSNAMQVKYLGNIYNLVQGQNSFWGIRLGYGEHTLQFLGSGTVSVEYRGGSL